MEREQSPEKNWLVPVLIGLGSLLFFILMVHFQPNGTDWARIGFRERTFMGFFQEVFHLYETENGRIFGNLFSTALITPGLLRDFIKTLFLIGTVIVLWGFNDRKDGFSFIWTFLLFVSMPMALAAQTLGWNTGFFHEVVPVYFFLIYLAWQKMDLTDKDQEANVPMGIFFFFLAFISMTFQESLSVILFMFSLILLVYEYRATKNIRMESVFWMVGTLLGLFVLFASPGFVVEDVFHMASSDTGIIQNFWENYHLFRSVSPFGNVIFFFLLLVTLIFRYQKNYSPWDYPMMIVGGMFFLYALFTSLGPEDFYNLNGVARAGDPSHLMLDFFIHILLFAFLIGIGFNGIEKPVEKKTWFLILTGIFVNFLLLLFVKNPMVKDYYFIFILTLILPILFLNEEIFDQEEKFRELFKASGLALILVIFLFHLNFLRDNTRVYEENTSKIQATMDAGALNVTIEKYPFEEYFTDPDNRRMMNAYYYNEPGDFKIMVRR